MIPPAGEPRSDPKEARMGGYTREFCLEAYRRLVRIRVFEETAAQLYRAGELPGFLHLSVGQEAVAVGVCLHLDGADVIASTHRGHGDVIAKGARLDRMMAELYARETGYCRGKGGSMHIADLDLGILGANGIVGGGLPIVAGAGLAFSMRGEPRVAVAFFGDGASNTGSFHEALNLAAVWQLPCVFVCENNGYAESTPRRVHQRVDDVAVRASAFAMPGVTIDGMDLFAVHAAAGEAIARAREGGGPTLLEARTYRYSGHHLGDPGTAYRTREEVEAHRARDPLRLFRDRAVRDGLVDPDALDAVEGAVAAEIEEAVRFAKASPAPRVESALEDIYS
jgi:pyruvate dehydrogenase E1 component alpha subunit